jgi:integrase
MADPPNHELTSYEDMRELLIGEYESNLRKTKDIIHLKLVSLDSFFKTYKAINITSKKIYEYVALRRESVKNATINRELSALRRMFSLAKQLDLVGNIPHIKKLQERNTRTGFLLHEDFLEIHKRLPDYIKPIAHLAYKSGMRKSEILNLKWEDVDTRYWIITLTNTKTDEPRIFPLDEELVRVFGVLSQQNKNSPYVFVNRRGRGRVKDFYYVWRKACSDAAEWVNKPYLKHMLFHDLRRTAVRNLIRAGVGRKVAMQISGHKTESIFERYNIISPEDLQEAVRLQGEFLRKQLKQFEDTLWDTAKM